MPARSSLAPLLLICLLALLPAQALAQRRGLGVMRDRISATVNRHSAHLYTISPLNYRR